APRPDPDRARPAARGAARGILPASRRSRVRDARPWRRRHRHRGGGSDRRRRDRARAAARDDGARARPRGARPAGDACRAGGAPGRGGAARGGGGGGQVVGDAGIERVTKRFDARVEVRPGARHALAHHGRVRVHAGTAEVLARAVLLDGAPELPPRGSGWAQLVLREPIVALRGDRFIVRDETARWTLGGGIVVNPFAERHRRAGRGRPAPPQPAPRGTAGPAPPPRPPARPGPPPPRAAL